MSLLVNKNRFINIGGSGMMWQRNEGEGVFSDPIICYSDNPATFLYGDAIESYLQLYDLLGSPLSSPLPVAGERRVILDLTSYPPGTYFFRISSQGYALGLGTLLRIP